MKVSTIFTIVLFLVALLGGIGATSYYYFQCNKAMTNEVYSYLESVAQSRANHIETFLDEKKILAENLALIGKVERALLEPSDANVLLVNERLQQTMDSVDSILSIGLLDKNGILIASTNPELIGNDYSHLYYFQKTDRETSFEFVERSGENSFFGVAAPVYYSNTKEFLGAVGININLEELNKITLDKIGIGETGEVYLVNSENYAITPLLFVEDAVLEWKIDTINSQNCFTAKETPDWVKGEHIGHEAIETFLDYRGEKVLGAHAYISEMKWCLLAEIDEAEILGKQRELFQRVSLIIIIVLVIIITLIGFAVGNFIDKRVVLKKGNKGL